MVSRGSSDTVNGLQVYCVVKRKFCVEIAQQNVLYMLFYVMSVLVTFVLLLLLQSLLVCYIYT